MPRSFGIEHLVSFGNFLLQSKGSDDTVGSEDVAAFEKFNSEVKPAPYINEQSEVLASSGNSEAQESPASEGSGALVD